MQERVESGQVKAYIEHKPIERFVINTHAFHNAHFLRACLPRILIAPIALQADRQAKHFEIAKSLRAAQDLKRKLTKVRSEQKKNNGASNSAEQTRNESGKRQRLEMEEEDLIQAV